MFSINYDWRKVQLGKPQPLHPNSTCWFKITGQKSFQQMNQNSTLNLREYFRIGCKISAVRLPQVQSHTSLSLYSYFTNRMGRTTTIEVNWQNLAATWAQVSILGYLSKFFCCWLSDWNSQTLLKIVAIPHFKDGLSCILQHEIIIWNIDVLSIIFHL